MDANEPNTTAGKVAIDSRSQTVKDGGHHRRRSTASQASLDSYDSALGDDADLDDLDPLNPDMDTADFHRRKKAQMMSNGGTHGKSYRAGEKRVTPNGAKSHQVGLSGTDDEDMELEEMIDEDGLSDDEETGLTKTDKRKRKKRRRRDTGLDARIGGSGMTAKQEQKLVDRAVMKSLTVNVILIGSWYFFSLTLSIVSPRRPLYDVRC